MSNSQKIDQRSVVIKHFSAQFGGEPVYVIRAPGRVNLIGDHTDYNDGFVMPMAIDRAIWLAVRPNNTRTVTVHSADFGDTAVFNLDALERIDSHWSEYVKGTAWALSERGYALAGWDGVVTGNIPPGAGLSSSAALEMAVAKAFALVSGFAWDGIIMPQVGQQAENGWMGANTGIMDQTISANGKAGHALLLDCRTMAMTHVRLPSDYAVVILDTGTRHQHTESGYNERREQCETAAQHFGVSHLRDVGVSELQAQADQLDKTTHKRARHVVTENARVLQAVGALLIGDIGTFGRLMNASHVSLRDDFENSMPAMDVMVALAQAHEACAGARMTGGGFGGAAVALVAAGQVEDFIRDIATAYREQTDYDAVFYVCQAAEGVGVGAG